MRLTQFLFSVLWSLVFLFGCKCNTQREQIKLGVILPLTGPLAEPGTNALNGVKIAIDSFNNSHNDKKIELLVEDSRSSPKDGVSAIKKLIEIDGTKIIIGDIMSSVFLATAPIAEKSKVTMISPGASSPDVKKAGDYIFRDYPSDEYDGEVMAKYIYNTLTKHSAVVIYVNNDYGTGVANRFQDVYSALGGKITDVIPYAEGQTNFKSITSKVNRDNPQILYIISNPAESGHIITALREQNIRIPVAGNLSFENESFIKIAKGAFDSIYFSSPYFNLDKGNQYTQYFSSEYQRRFSKKPDIAAALGYDVAMICIEALAKSNYNLSQFNESLYRIQNFQGITGKTSFDKYGDVQKSITIKLITGNGQIKVIDSFEN